MFRFPVIVMGIRPVGLRLVEVTEDCRAANSGKGMAGGLYYTGFNLYGGIEGFREIIKEIPFLSPRDMNFACIVFDLKKEDLKCYTRKLSRERLLNS